MLKASKNNYVASIKARKILQANKKEIKKDRMRKKYKLIYKLKVNMKNVLI